MKKEDVYQLISQLEEDIEQNIGYANDKHIPTRHLMLFFLFGGHEDSRQLLKRKVENLLRNTNASSFVNIDISANGIENGGYEELVEDILQKAAQNHADVQDLNTVRLYPVLYSADYNGDSFLQFTQAVNRTVAMMGKFAIWQPFIIMEQKVSQYPNIRRCIKTVQQFLTEPDRSSSMNRCCILSNQADNGFVVPEENILLTVAMAAVLQNVDGIAATAVQSYSSMISISSNEAARNDVFFTARNYSVSSPTRSIVLQRMLTAMDYFSGEIDQSTGDTPMRMNFSFLNEIIAPDLKKLPHLHGKITFFPLYSVMGEGAELRERLQQEIRTVYEEPLYGENRARRLEQSRLKFLEEYFKSNGSLSGLETLVGRGGLGPLLQQHQSEFYQDLPFEEPLPAKGAAKPFTEGVYAEACRYVENKVRNAASGLADDLSRNFSNPDMRSAIRTVLENLQMIRKCIEERLRLLKDAESVFVFGDHASTDNFYDEQRKWLETDRNHRKAEYEISNRKYDEQTFRHILYPDSDYSQMIRICYDAVKNTADTNAAYLQKLSDECNYNGDKADEFLNIIEQNWGYTIRFINRDHSQDKTCVIGSADNGFSRRAVDRFLAASFHFPDFERIDILHVSSPFAPENINEWKYIASADGEKGASV